MENPPFTRAEMRRVIANKAESELRQRVLADLEKSDSYVRLVLNGLSLKAREALNVDWLKLLNNGSENLNDGEDAGDLGMEEATPDGSPINKTPDHQSGEYI